MLTSNKRSVSEKCEFDSYVKGYSVRTGDLFRRLIREEIEISVIIPSYNPNLDTLTECLKAIHHSNFEPLEVILVNDGSLMEYPKEIKEYCRVINNKENRGSAFARNIGAKEARGNILFFIDADVRITESTLIKILEKFCDEDIAAVQTLYSESTSVKNLLSQYINLYQHYNFNTINQKYLCTLSSYAVAIRKDVFFETGGFLESLRNPSVEDEVLGIALYRRGYKILLAKDIRVEHLACFDIKKLLKRMFTIGRDAIEYSCGHKKLQRIELSKTHHSMNLVASLLLSPLILFLLMISIFSIARIIAILFILVFLLINAGFFMFIYKHKGVSFMLKSIAVYYLMCLSAFLGCIKGSANYFLK